MVITVFGKKSGFKSRLALDSPFPLAARQRIQWRRSRQASGAIRPRTASRVLASGTGTNSLPEANVSLSENKVFIKRNSYRERRNIFPRADQIEKLRGELAFGFAGCF